MFIEKFLNENGLDPEVVPEIEPTNEGFDMEALTITDAIGLMEADMHKLEMSRMALEVNSVANLHRGKMLVEDAIQLQEASIKGAFDAIKGFLSKMWARIKEAWNTFLIKIMKLFKADGKLLQLASAALKNITHTENIEVDGYVYTLDAVVPMTVFTKMKTKIEAATGDYDAICGKEAIDAYCEAGTGYAKDKYVEELKKALRNGASEKVKIKFNQQTVEENIKGYKLALSKLKDLKKDIDKAGSDSIAAINKLKKDAEKDEDKKTYEARAKAMKDASTVAAKCVQLKIDAIKEQVGQSRSLLSKAVSGGRKADREAAKAAKGASKSTDDNAQNTNEGVDFAALMRQF